MHLRGLCSLLLAAALAQSGCVGDVGATEEDVEAARGERSEERDGGKRDAKSEDDSDETDDGEDDSDETDDDDAADDERDSGPSTRMTATRDAGGESEEDVDGGEGEGDAAEPESPVEECTEESEHPLAEGLRIREIALYQTVKVTLFEDGAWVSEPSTPVIQGKKSLARVFVETESGYTRRPVRAVLTLTNGSEQEVLRDERTISTNSSDEQEDSTFNFPIEGSNIGPDTELSIAIEEVACDGEPEDVEGARFPASGTQALTAAAIGNLRVVVVPISMGGRVPDTSAAEVEKLRAALLAYYPVPDVELTVRAQPLTWSRSLAGTDSNGWSTLLNEVMRQRASDRPESDVYYFGLVQPASSMREYCGRGCIMGIAPQTTRVSAGAQVGLGASFSNAQTYETLVHEIAHAHGRGHAPCAQGGSIQGVDRSFPDRTGATAVWGWDSRESKLLPPTRKDIMGYCQPNWISGYTYKALAARAQQVNQRAFFVPPANATRWLDVVLYDDGTARWGGLIETSTPGGELIPAQALDAAGNVLAEIEVSRLELSHSDDVFLYLPAPGAHWAAIAFEGHVIELAQILPPL